MDKKLQKYIEKRKRDFLVEEGLFDKIYEPEEAGHDVDEYPHSENNNGLNHTRYYKIVPYDVTDEEFDTLLRLHSVSKKSKDKDGQTSGYATFMIIVAVIIYIAGLIAGFMMGRAHFGFSSEVAVIYWIIAFAAGSLFIGIAGIIKSNCSKN